MLGRSLWRIKRRAKRALPPAFGFVLILLAGAFPVRADMLKWAPPPLVDPVTVTVEPGDFMTRQPTDRDCILRWPVARHLGFVMIEGCHNLVSMGGWNSIPQGPDRSNKALARILYLKGLTGTAHIEGLLGDSSAGGMSDCIDIWAPEATVQIENVRCDGLIGFNDQFHADCIQPFGGVKALRVYNFTCRTGYQGLSVWPVELSPLGWSVDLERVNVISTGRQIWGRGNNGGYLYWPCGERHCANVAATTLREVYLQPRPEKDFASTVYSVRTHAVDWPPALSEAGDEIRFPGLPIKGVVRRGPPPEGDFVPVGRAGPGYATPGYQVEPLQDLHAVKAGKG